MPVDLRAAYLDVACGGNQELRDEVESLLATEMHAKRFLETPAVLLADTGAKRLEGQRVGPYQITSGIGAGGMGEVYRAYDAKLGRDVAIKILPRIFASDPDRLARFDREARMLASLNHPHIGAIYGVEQSEGAPALVLELVEGPTLADRLATGPILLTESLGIVRQIADALEAAHAKGIIHRDLKPANIKITPDGIVKVLDFGLAKAVASDGIHDLSKSPTVAVSGSHEGVILGTAAYMSPEQARGQTVDKRTDIWAFGCVLYEMLTGRMAFPGRTASDCIAAILERDPDWAALPVPTPLSIRRLLRRCLEKESARRLPDIAVARLEIDDAAGDPGGAAEAARCDAALTRPRVEDCLSGGSGDCFGHDRLHGVVGDAAATDGRADHVHASGTGRASVSLDLRIAQPVAGRPHRRFRGDRYDRASCGCRNRRRRRVHSVARFAGGAKAFRNRRRVVPVLVSGRQVRRIHRRRELEEDRRCGRSTGHACRASRRPLRLERARRYPLQPR